MTPPRFLIGHHPRRGELWAAVDPNMHHLQSAIGERRFAAYLSPFRDEDSARAALIAAGAQAIHAEERGGKRHGS
jgi:hypothetical protein